MSQDYGTYRPVANSRVELEQFIQGYDDNGLGLVHGLQKDAVQNSIGAAKNQKRLKDWSVTFRRVQIDGIDALSIQDEGTTGLIGDILTQNDIEHKQNAGELDERQALARFMSSGNTGGNHGPGAFGRGKQIYQALSRDYSVIVDSLREDGSYVAFKRFMTGSVQKITDALIDDRAIRFIREESCGSLDKLDSVGTRVTILNVKSGGDDELGFWEVFRNSFDDIADPNYNLRLDSMIQDTWWEILGKSDGKIFLEDNGQKKQVILNDDMKYRMIDDHEKAIEWEKIQFSVNGQLFRIKTLRLYVLRNKEDENPEVFRGVFAHRKRMCVGRLNAGDRIDNSVRKRFGGYVRFEPAAEEEIKAAENLEHYKIKQNKQFFRELNEVLRTKVDEFQSRLGIVNRNRQPSDRLLQNALQDLNEIAGDMGLIQGTAPNNESRYLSINQLAVHTPSETSRIDYNTEIGPVEFVIQNRHPEQCVAELLVTHEQNEMKFEVLRRNISIDGNGEKKFNIPKFEVSSQFNPGMTFLKVQLVNKRCQNSRSLWLDQDPPEVQQKDMVKRRGLAPSLPNRNSRRVNLDQSIENLGFSLVNQSGYALPVRVKMVVQHKSTSNQLGEIFLQDLSLSANEEKQLDIPDLIVDKYPALKLISDEEFSDEARHCRIQLKITAAEHLPELEIIKGKPLTGTWNFSFYLEKDDPGRGVFINGSEDDKPEDGRRSWFEGDMAIGYQFIFNSGHPKYHEVKSFDNTDYTESYYFEEMLKQAYFIAIRKGVYKGPFEDESRTGKSFKDLFSDDNGLTHEILEGFDEFYGLALIKRGQL